MASKDAFADSWWEIRVPIDKVSIRARPAAAKLLAYSIPRESRLAPKVKTIEAMAVTGADRPLRILMLSNFYPPFLGGEENNTRKLSAALAARGHHVAVATLWHPGLARFEVVDGVQVHRVDSLTRRLRPILREKDRVHVPPVPDPIVVANLRAVVRRDKPDVVHAHNWLVHSFLPIKAWSGARLIMGLHDYGLACATTLLQHHDQLCTGPALAKCLPCAAGVYGAARGTAVTLANWAMAAFQRGQVDHFITISEATARGNQLPQRGLPYTAIPNFMTVNAPPDTGDEHPLLAQLPQEPFLLYVGAFAPHKGVDVLLRAYRGLRHAPPLVLIGYAETEPLIDWPPNVHVYRNWPNDAVMGAWRHSLLGVIPSVWAEPFGTVALEAMASARPTVASAVGGLQEIVVDGETGLLVPPGNAGRLRDALQALIDSPDLRRRMGTTGLDRLAGYQESVVVARFEAVYRRVLVSSAA